MLLTPFQYIFMQNRKIDNQVMEIVDAIKYFRENAAEYKIDPEKIIIMGYSAGGYLTLGATQQLAQEGITIYGQVIGYGYLRDGIEQYQKIPDENKPLCNTLIVFTNKDDFILSTMRKYYDILKKDNVSVSKLELPNANHGFLEENNPEYNFEGKFPGRGEEQEKYMYEAEAAIEEWISMLN